MLPLTECSEWAHPAETIRESGFFFCGECVGLLVWELRLYNQRRALGPLASDGDHLLVKP